MLSLFIRPTFHVVVHRALKNAAEEYFLRVEIFPSTHALSNRRSEHAQLLPLCTLVSLGRGQADKCHSRASIRNLRTTQL